MLSSARVGLAAALKARPAAVLVLPVDHPEVRGETVEQLSAMMSQVLSSFEGNGARQFPYALVPRYRGKRGHPLVLSAALARQSVLAVPLSAYLSQKPARGGLVLGFGGVDEQEIAIGVERIAVVAREMLANKPASR